MTRSVTSQNHHFTMPRSGLVQRASGPNPYAFGTSGISPAEQARMPEASRDRSLETLAVIACRAVIKLLCMAQVFQFRSRTISRYEVSSRFGAFWLTVLGRQSGARLPHCSRRSGIGVWSRLPSASWAVEMVAASDWMTSDTCLGGVGTSPSTHHRLSFMEMTRMTANQVTAANAGWRWQFRLRGSHRRPGVAEFYR